MTRKGNFLRKINEAYSNNDIDFIVDNVTNDILWTVQGDFTLEGKKAFTEAMKKLESEGPLKLQISNIITHGDSAAVDGTMRSADGSTYAFCDIYRFSGFKNPKIREMTSYVIDITEV